MPESSHTSLSMWKFTLLHYLCENYEKTKQNKIISQNLFQRFLVLLSHIQTTKITKGIIHVTAYVSVKTRCCGWLVPRGFKFSSGYIGSSKDIWIPHWRSTLEAPEVQFIVGSEDNFCSSFFCHNESWAIAPTEAVNILFSINFWPMSMEANFI